MTSFRKSVEWALGTGASTVEAWPLMLLRGTKLHKNKLKLGLVEDFIEEADNNIRTESRIPHVISSPSFTVEDWQKMRSIANGINSRV